MTKATRQTVMEAHGKVLAQFPDARMGEVSELVDAGWNCGLGPNRLRDLVSAAYMEMRRTWASLASTKRKVATAAEGLAAAATDSPRKSLDDAIWEEIELVSMATHQGRYAHMNDEAIDRMATITVGSTLRVVPPLPALPLAA